MFLTIDQGTTSSKAVLFDINGQKIDVSQKVFKQIFPKDGWVEHDPLDILHTVIQCCEDILSRNLKKKHQFFSYYKSTRDCNCLGQKKWKTSTQCNSLARQKN